ncbi:MAG TPA: transglutaminase family protein [Caulobacteraceae bacterium]|jgi:transglutaminase-like putative cysteine protease|nr:transglutaminase family protein [Caulobacteraceae bacterium]
MLLDIRHLTQYHYAAPVRESVIELWVQPQKSGRQRLVSFELEIDPSVQLFSYADAFGNAVYHFDVPQPHEHLAIQARSAVETNAAAPLPERLELAEWERLSSDVVRSERFDYLHPHGFAASTPMLESFVQNRRLDQARALDPLSAVRSVCETVCNALEYQHGVTRADSPIDLTLAAGRGVCQDFAHIVIAICRSWGVPARYVSGYLFTDRTEGDRSDPDATHAWVEVYLPSLGWVGIDPANNIAVGERHVVVATGRDYSDLPPSRGVYKGDADSALSVAVSVRQARHAAAEPEFMRTARPAFSGPTRRRSPHELSRQMQQQQQQ